MTPEEIAKANQDGIDKLKADLALCVEKKDFDALKTTLDEFIEKNKNVDFDALKTQLKDVNESLAEIKDQMTGKGIPVTMESAKA